MILGAVLAGGEARRFGSDKARALLDGKAMIDHVIDALKPVVDELVICGRSDDRHRAIPDAPSVGMGPLGGLSAALHEARSRGFDRVLSMPCDTPVMDAALLATLAAREGPAYVRDCPVIGIWPAAFADDLSDWLASSDDRSIRGWARSIHAALIATPPPLNVNRPADLDSLRR